MGGMDSSDPGGCDDSIAGGGISRASGITILVGGTGVPSIGGGMTGATVPDFKPELGAVADVSLLNLAWPRISSGHSDSLPVLEDCFDPDDRAPVKTLFMDRFSVLMDLLPSGPG